MKLILFHVSKLNSNRNDLTFMYPNLGQGGKVSNTTEEAAGVEEPDSSETVNNESLKKHEEIKRSKVQSKNHTISTVLPIIMSGETTGASATPAAVQTADSGLLGISIIP